MCTRRTLFGVLALIALAGCDDDVRSMPDTGTLDGGPPDTGPRDRFVPGDTELPESCDVGSGCDPTRGCRTSPTCIGELDTEVGGAADPITGLPSGGDGIPVTTWTGGYCSMAGTASAGGCDVDDDDSCGGLSCAVCVNAGTDPTTGMTVGLCAATCTPSLTANPCRDTYECSLTIGACLPGCTTDDECRVTRPDTNENGIIDPYDPMTNATGDHLVYDDSTLATCNATTARCDHDGAAGAEAGATCATDFDCEANGDCIADAGDEGGWPGGYCTKLGCDIAGNDCAGMGKCQERGIGVALCVEACEVGAVETGGDAFSPSRDCRAGYACFWDGTGGVGAPDNGACIPGNYNDVRTANIGAPCTDETTCLSPHGFGQCRDFGGGNHCTLFDCAAPGLDGVCGTEALCASIMGSDTSLCMETCETADDCALPGAGCWDTTAAGISTGMQKVCFPGCLADADCRTGATCVGASTTMVGECT